MKSTLQHSDRLECCVICSLRTISDFMGVLAMTSERHLEIVDRNALKILHMWLISLLFTPQWDVQFYLMFVRKKTSREPSHHVHLRIFLLQTEQFSVSAKLETK